MVIRSVTKVEMTDISACGRIVFHIPWCPDCLSLIRKKKQQRKKKVFATSFSRLFLIYLRVMAKNKNFRKFPCKRVSNQNWFFRNASFSDHPAPPRLHPGLYARSNIPQANKPNATWSYICRRDSEGTGNWLVSCIYFTSIC